MKSEILSKHASDLVHTSLDDARSTINCSYKDAGDLSVLKEARDYCKGRTGYHAKYKLFAATIKRLEKTK